ncbi:type III-A CRISPR-associated RAMP protein Csm3 [Halomonas campisalis]|uniref:CRISPR system Cms endoribonuclease Csm3 n=1 Tax=Billgrantia campisalis TaxID=74661 RepID=A0ABS9PCJ2_9GAMM|nr:type III-A CRISPR-associated RAMP protein Csm3 [Halomonas campisalis]MCG6659396.1 type III-A CRISPR-associated RAMP protein Csm3 [Halomonas campisalis]MDR5863998.1 type III-A CRISPR-associated RAMP protein Csm3 [Halomonas campisalis]
MKLEAIDILEGTLEVVTGLHIGAGSAGMRIGGIDSPVVKHPLTELPYIPGSSLKGKVRSLLEWQAGAVVASNGGPVSWEQASQAEDTAMAKRVVQLFGTSGDAKLDMDEALALGPTRLAFWDCQLCSSWLEEIDWAERRQPLTEEKSENSIDRIRGVAQNPRFIERVPAGARFDFRLTFKRLTDDDDALLDLLLRGLALLELDGLGGSGSRGYGKVRFSRLQQGDTNLCPRLREALSAT